MRRSANWRHKTYASWDLPNVSPEIKLPVVWGVGGGDIVKYVLTTASRVHIGMTHPS